MGRGFGDDDSDSKSKLVIQICNVSTRAIVCANTHSNADFVNSPFIDWYLVLQVDENVGIDTIKKKYHKLALQLHPDKNNHSMAETAFKLLSEVVKERFKSNCVIDRTTTLFGGYEYLHGLHSTCINKFRQAYACLSDDSRRFAFDVERRNSFCFECSKICSGKAKGIFNVERLRSNMVLKRIREIRLRFMEEARIIEECLKANSAPRKDYPCFGSSREIPIFNPRNRREYPNQWNKSRDGFLYLQRQSGFELGRGSCDSPIFECRRSDKRRFKFGF